MSSAPKKLATLLELRARAVDTAEHAVAEHARQVEAATRALRSAERTYDAALLDAATAREETAWDAGYRRSHLEALQGVIARAAAGVRDAEAKEAIARAALVEAKREHKKLELWCDAKVRDAESEAARKERAAVDALAMRGALASAEGGMFGGDGE